MQKFHRRQHFYGMLPNSYYLLVLYPLQSFTTILILLKTKRTRQNFESRIKIESISRSTANKGNPIFQTNFLNEFKQN